MNVEFVRMPSRVIAGRMVRTDVGSIGITDSVGSLWSDFYQAGKSSSIPDADITEYESVTANYSYDKGTSSFNVIVGCLVNSKCALHDELDTFTLPEGIYAKVSLNDTDPDTVSRAWSDIYNHSGILNKCDFEVELKAYKTDKSGIDIVISTT